MHFNISCSTDNNYLQHCMAMLCSVFDNNTSHDITVHLLHSNLSESSQSIVSKLCERYGQTIIFYDMSRIDSFKDVHITHEALSEATYYRLVLESVIPQNIEKILYLDCDVIVLNDLSELFNIRLNNYGVAAVRDSCPYDNSHRLSIGIGLNDKMFCAGVLLINLEYWRNNDCQKVFFDYLKAEGCNLRFEDQDILNYTFRNNWLQLPYKYGVSPFSISVLDNGQKIFDYTEYYLNPIIIHFATHVKPWLNIRIPLDEFYWKYAVMSDFPNPVTTFASKDTIKKIRRLKIRYFISTFIRPFVPNIIEILAKDILNLLMLLICVFNPKKFKSIQLKRWMEKHHIYY